MKRMDTGEKRQWLDRKAVGRIAERELPKLSQEQIWILKAYSYEYGTSVYRITAYGELVVYDIIIDAYQGELLKKTVSCL